MWTPVKIRVNCKLPVAQALIVSGLGRAERAQRALFAADWGDLAQYDLQAWMVLGHFYHLRDGGEWKT